MSRSASEPLPLSPVISKNPCGQRVILREAEKRRRIRFAARKAWRGIEGRNRRASGARDLSEPSRSESEAERVWKVASGTWETCGAKASAGVGGNRSSDEAGNDRGAKGSRIESASNRSAGADSLRKKRMTEEEIAAIAAKHRMTKFPNLALTRERLSRKVNHYVLKRMARFLNRKSQRYYRLKFADTYYGEMTHYGLYRLAWADVGRTRN